MTSRQSFTLEEFHAAIKAQGAPSREHIAFICPMCDTVQSGDDFIAVGAGSTFDEIEKYLGFACIGRFTGAGSPRKAPDGKPCNWTLGGLLQLHTLEVVTPDGERHPMFQLATAEQAAAHAASRIEGTAP